METKAIVNTAMPANGQIEKFVPVYFGENTELYGCYHIAEQNHNSSAVLLCQSIGHEYERCHRAMRQLAVQSARKDIAAMRFDYFGTGDSAGSAEETTLVRMRQDIEQAIEACKRKTGAEHITLAGLRLGATLAAQVASSRTDIESLVLYAPVYDGQGLLDEWQHEQHVFDNKHSHTPRQARTGEILGFPVTDAFHNELTREVSLTITNSCLKKVLILADEVDTKSVILKKWVDMFKSHDVMVTIELPENLAIWRREAIESIVPIKIIRRIVKWIAEN